MKFFKWAGTDCWLGYIKAEGWYLYLRILQISDFDESNKVLLINIQGQEDLRDKNWVRKSFEKSNAEIPSPEIVGRMKARVEIITSRLNAQVDGFGGWSGVSDQIGSHGYRAFDPSTGDRFIPMNYMNTSESE